MTRRRAFRVFKCPDTGFWRWECTLCHPATRGARSGPDAARKIWDFSLRGHMRHRYYHHRWVAANLSQDVSQ